MGRSAFKHTGGTMNIAINGWYVNKDLFKPLKKISNYFDITVVMNRHRAAGHSLRPNDNGASIPKMIKKYLVKSGIKLVLRDPGGLEWGGYDYYIKNCWDRRSAVLFMHDDIKIYDPKVFYQIEMQMKEEGVNQAFIFRDEAEEIANGRMHGRAVYCSAKFINFALLYQCACAHTYKHEHPHHKGQNPIVILQGTGVHNGFWYDKFNLDEHVDGKPPLHCRHYNEGIYHFAAFAGRCIRNDGIWPGLEKVKERRHFPDFNSGKRGSWSGRIYGRGKKI
jgi:hypothetical protein